MLRAAVVALALMASFDLVVCDGKYTSAASQVSSALMRQFW
jgi:hypothetical protein